jgi:hypothetical protein
MLSGLPDLAIPALREDTVTLFYPYPSGQFGVLPNTLSVPVSPGGIPDLSLTVVRGCWPGAPPEPHAVLDLRLVAGYPMAQAEELARRHRPDLPVRPVPPVGGFMHLAATAPDLVVPTALGEPAVLALDCLGRGRYTARLPADAAPFVESLLASGEAPVQAVAELEYLGVGNRLNAQVRFSPSVLLSELTGEGADAVSRDKLLRRLRDELTDLALDVTAHQPPDPQILAEAMLDRLRARFGRPAPATPGTSEPRLAFPAVDLPDMVTWDLAEPAITWRPLTLQLDALAAVRGYTAQHGTGALVHRRTVPPLFTGQLMVTAAASLPATRPGVLRIGVELSAPPRPPVRPQEARDEAEFVAPDDLATLRLRLSPAEAAEYDRVTYTVLRSNGNQMLRSPAVHCNGPSLSLGAKDFPITFLPVRVDDALLDLATARVRFTPGDPAYAPQEAELTRAQPATAFAEPADSTTPGALKVCLRPFDPEASPIDADVPLDAAALLDIHMLPGAGPQEVRVTAHLHDPDQPEVLAVQLVPEDRTHDDTAIGLVVLTRARPTVTWTYLPVSPFRPGFRWRWFGAGEEPAPWSGVCNPGQALELTARSANPP